MPAIKIPKQCDPFSFSLNLFFLYICKIFINNRVSDDNLTSKTSSKVNSPWLDHVQKYEEYGKGKAQSTH